MTFFWGAMLPPLLIALESCTGTARRAPTFLPKAPVGVPPVVARAATGAAPTGVEIVAMPHERYRISRLYLIGRPRVAPTADAEIEGSPVDAIEFSSLFPVFSAG